MLLHLLPLLLLPLLLLASPARAATLTFFAQNIGTGAVPGTLQASRDEEVEFLANLVSPLTEDFSTFDVADKGELRIFLDNATLSDTVDSGGSIRVDLEDAANRGFGTTPWDSEDEDRFWKNETTSNAMDELFRVCFDQEVRAFGFYATAWSTEASPGNDATQLALYLGRPGMDPERIVIPHDDEENPGGVFYFGVIADLPFIKASLRNESTTDPGDRIGFDGFTMATTIVPEPATGLLLAGGLAGLAAARRRRPRA
jgi:hypothetical protein